MAETASTPAAGTPASAPPAPAPAAPAKIELKLPAPAAKPGDPAKPSEPAKPAETTAPAAPDAELIKQVAKASAAERKANALVADLQTQLKTATGTATEVQQKAAMFDAVVKNPRLLLDHGVTWEQVLDSISGKEEAPEDPRLAKTKAELDDVRKRLDDRDAKEKSDREAKESAAAEASNAKTVEAVKAMIDTDGAAPDKDGFPRWAIMSQDPGAIDRAVVAVGEFLLEQDAAAKKADPKASFTVTKDEAMDLARQALDQMETHERAKVSKYIAAQPKPVVGASQESLSKPQSKPRAELPPDVSKTDATKGKSTEGPRTRPATF